MTKKTGILCILILILSGIGYGAAWIRPAYLEYQTIGGQEGAIVSAEDGKQENVVSFRMPYDILCGVVTDSDNGAQSYTIVEAKTQKTLLKSRAENGVFVQRLTHNVPVKKNEIYELHLEAGKAPKPSGVGIGGGPLLRIYGGDRSRWWFAWTTLLAVLLFAFGFCRIRLMKKGRDWRQSRVFCSLLLFFLTLSLWSVFALQDRHGDETAVIMEGMLLAKGKVLYRDCIEQHMPLASYLCAVFAGLGAETILQFRLSWYLLLSAIWGCLYWRHGGRFKKRIFFLPLLHALFVPSGVVPYGYVLLGDGIFEISMIAFILEFLRYLEDQRLGWGRCAIFSVCFLGCFGTEFVSLYALFGLFLFALYKEAGYWKGTGPGIRKVIGRYGRLAICFLIPAAAVAAYFMSHHALHDLYDQTYRFNTEVYSAYNGGLGINKITPFFYGIQNCLKFAVMQIRSFLNPYGLMRLLIFAGAAFSVFSLIKSKRYETATCLGLCICLCAIRLINNKNDLSYHGACAWGLMILAAALYWKPFPGRSGRILTACVLLLAVGIYTGSFYKALCNPEPTVSDLEHAVVERTEEGEAVFMDAFDTLSPYLLYRNRYPANRLLWMLPWYLDRYEQTAIDDLNAHQPGLVIFDESRRIWGSPVRFDALPDALRENYTQLSDDEADGWKYRVWVRNAP